MQIHLSVCCSYSSNSGRTMRKLLQQCTEDRNVDKSKLETRLVFADKASMNKVCSRQLVIFQDSCYINSAVESNDTSFGSSPLTWFQPSFLSSVPIKVNSLQPSVFVHHCSFSNLPNRLSEHSCKSSEGQHCACLQRY